MSVQRPTNEQELILKFVSEVKIHGFQIIRVFSCFPDAEIFDTENQISYYVEFEYKLSSFIKHGHDPFGCNFVICWENDLKTEFPMTVFEVSKGIYPEIKIPDEEKRYEFKIMIDKKKIRKPYKSPSPDSMSVFDGLLEKLKS